jgi:hypothetical protein
MADCPKGGNPKVDKNIELVEIQGAIERKIHLDHQVLKDGMLLLELCL